MKNANDLGYGICPGCKEWKHLTRYHPKDAKKKRREKSIYCSKCILSVVQSRTPFHELKKAVISHKTLAGEGDYTFRDIMALHKRQGCKCAYCGTNMPYKASLDHIIPKKFEGKNLLHNVILTCLTCNTAKQHFELFYFIRRKKFLLTEKNIQRIRRAYDEHDYECIGTCEDCKGNSKARSNPACEGCVINPERYLAEQVRFVQKSAAKIA